MTDPQASSVPAADQPVVAPLRELTRRRWPALTTKIVLLVGLLGVLTALSLAVVALVAVLVVTSTAG